MFAHDHVFYRHGSDVYTSGSLSYAVWSRYLALFDNLTVAARTQDPNDGIDLSKLALSSGPKVDFLEIPTLSNPVAMIANRAKAASVLSGALEKADGLIARLPSEIGSVAIRQAEQMGKPWAVEVVGCVWDGLWNYGNWQGKAYAPFAYWQARSLIKRAPYALYVTQNFLQNRYPCNGKAVGCSDVEIPDVVPETLEKRLDAIRSGRNSLKIGLIGSLSSKYKGIDVALKALKIAQSELPSFEFHILGGGDSRPWRRLAAEEGLEGQTFFDGTLPGGLPVRRWLDDISIYIQPSFQEGLPRALVEAMSRGLPALGSTAGGIPELLESSCLHKPGDSARLADHLIRAAKDDRWQIEQAQRNFELSGQFTTSRLERVRSEFWRGFAGEVASKRK